MRWILVTIAGLVLAGLTIGRLGERFINQVDPAVLPAVSEAARRLHRSTFVVDLHADSLMFGRDLLARSRVGHVDLPRLQSGGVGLQVFGVVTKVPGTALVRNPADGLDRFTLVSLAQLSPMVWQAPFERALHQAARLHRFNERSGGQLALVRTRADLERLLELRARDPRVVGALLALEGAHPLEAGPGSLRELFDAGFRMLGLAHFSDNRYAGSAHGVAKGGLTAEGRVLVRHMQELGMVVDLAHLAPEAIDELLSLSTQPTVVSHGGVKGTCDNPRNLSDAHVRAIARGGGVIGIGYFEWAICGIELDQIVRAIRYAIELVGDAYVGLGSDFDGGTRTGFDASQLPALTQALFTAGLGEDSIRKVLGGNVLRVLRQTLPPG